MKKTLALSLLLSGLLFMSSCSESGKKEGTKVAADSTSIDSEKVSYACPMDTDVVSDKPGACTKCGMDLEKVAMAPVK